MVLFDEKELKLFIEEKFKVSSYKTPFYIKWIKMYNNFAANSGSVDDTQNKFVSSLEPHYPDWQVKQADKAVTIYLSFIRKGDRSSTKNRIKDNSVWKNVIDKAGMIWIFIDVAPKNYVKEIKVLKLIVL